jgi:hypothetical protein
MGKMMLVRSKITCSRAWQKIIFFEEISLEKSGYITLRDSLFTSSAGNSEELDGDLSLSLKKEVRSPIISLGCVG